MPSRGHDFVTTHWWLDRTILPLPSSTAVTVVTLGYCAPRPPKPLPPPLETLSVFLVASLSVLLRIQVCLSCSPFCISVFPCDYCYAPYYCCHYRRCCSGVVATFSRVRRLPLLPLLLLPSLSCYFSTCFSDFLHGLFLLRLRDSRTRQCISWGISKPPSLLLQLLLWLQQRCYLHQRRWLLQFGQRPACQPRCYRWRFRPVVRWHA